MEENKDSIVTLDTTVECVNDVEIKLDGFNEGLNNSSVKQTDKERIELETVIPLEPHSHIQSCITTAKQITEITSENAADTTFPPVYLPTPSLTVIPTTPSATSLVTLPIPPTTPPATPLPTTITTVTSTQLIPEMSIQSNEITTTNSGTFPNSIQTTTTSTTTTLNTNNNEKHDTNLTINTTTENTSIETVKKEEIDSEVQKMELAINKPGKTTENKDEQNKIILQTKLDSPETPTVTDKSGKNPFTKSGKLSRKADYIISHSTITRNNIRISDPDLPSQPIIQQQQTEVLLVKPEAFSNGHAGSVVEVMCVKVDSPETDKAEQVKLLSKNNCSCGRCCCECCVKCCGRCCSGCCSRCKAACSIQ